MLVILVVSHRSFLFKLRIPRQAQDDEQEESSLMSRRGRCKHGGMTLGGTLNVPRPMGHSQC